MPGIRFMHRASRRPFNMSTDSLSPRVLVLMATFNGAEWLRPQVDSILEQEGVRVRLRVSDDGSTDDTLSQLQDLQRQHVAIEVLTGHDQRLGACGNFLRLLRESSFDDIDYVAFADQDDVWLPWKLLRGTAQLRSTGAAAYSSDAIAFWPDGRRRPLGKASPQRAMDYLFEPAGPGCTYLLCKELAIEIQQELRRDPDTFAGVWYHDWLIYAYARARGQAWTIDQEAGVLYRQHGRNELGANFGVKGIFRRWGRLTSGWFRGQVLLIAAKLPPHDSGVVDRLHRFSLRDRLWLAARACQLRRRPRDQLALATMLLLGVLR